MNNPVYYDCFLLCTDIEFSASLDEVRVLKFKSPLRELGSRLPARIYTLQLTSDRLKWFIYYVVLIGQRTVLSTTLVLRTLRWAFEKII